VQKLIKTLLATAWLASAGLAHGQTATYTFTGVGDGTVNGTNFTEQTYTFKVTALTATVQNSAPPYSNVLNGGTITISGTACATGCSITSPGNYLVFNTAGVSSWVHGLSVVGDLDLPGDTLLEACYNCGGTTINDNLVTPVSPTLSGDDGALLPYFAFPSSGGVVQITDLDSEITYSVTLGSAITVTPVPTLSTPGLLLLGLLVALGAPVALRRRWGGNRA
jgi:hypothetical protein